MFHVVVDAAKTGKKLGVMVIDQVGGADLPLLKRQCRVLNFARQQMGWPIWFVSMKNDPLHSMLHAAAPTATLYQKTRFNAFDVDELRLAVGAARVEAIVMMGHATNQCVRQSAVGGFPDRLHKKPFTEGATGHGHTVMTCTDVLSGGEAVSWCDNPKVLYYARLMPPKPAVKPGAEGSAT